MELRDTGRFIAKFPLTSASILGTAVSATVVNTVLSKRLANHEINPDLVHFKNSSNPSKHVQFSGKPNGESTGLKSKITNALKSGARKFDRNVIEPVIGKSSDTYREEAAAFAATPSPFARKYGRQVQAETDRAILDSEKATRVPRWATRGAIGTAAQFHTSHTAASPMTGLPLAAAHTIAQGTVTGFTETLQRAEMERRMPDIPRHKAHTKAQLAREMATGQIPLGRARRAASGKPYGLRDPKSQYSNEFLNNLLNPDSTRPALVSREEGLEYFMANLDKEKPLQQSSLPARYQPSSSCLSGGAAVRQRMINRESERKRANLQRLDREAGYDD